MEDSPEDSYERRREQVRRAQKTHRARKANYVKNLEEEVSELRKQNASFLTIIRRYQTIMNQYGIPNSVYDGEAESSHPWATVNYIGGTQGVQVTLPSTEPSTQATMALQGIESAYLPRPDSSPLGNIPPSVRSSVSNPTGTIYLQNLDLTQLGINFVLALERPCLTHHKGDKDSECPVADGDDLGGTGHANMLSSPIMARSPPFPLNPAHAADAQWTVPQEELEALLRFSQSLDLDGGEVTPVQAWQAIRQHPNFLFLSYGRLEQLKNTLCPLVKCYGFGGVIDREAFELAMAEAFSSVERF